MLPHFPNEDVGMGWRGSMVILILVLVVQGSKLDCVSAAVLGVGCQRPFGQKAF